MGRNIHGGVDILELTPSQRLTSTDTGTGVDIKDYEGTLKVVLASSAGGGTTPTMNAKIQDSADNSTFADVSGSVFAEVTDAADAHLAIGLDTNAVRRYIRTVATITGTSPTFDMSILAFGAKKYMS